MWTQETLECVRKAQDIHGKLQDAGIDSKLLDYSNTVYFPRPKNLEGLKNWMFASTDSISHIITMQSVTMEVIEDFVSCLVKCI